MLKMLFSVNNPFKIEEPEISGGWELNLSRVIHAAQSLNRTQFHKVSLISLFVYLFLSVYLSTPLSLSLSIFFFSSLSLHYLVMVYL